MTRDEVDGFCRGLHGATSQIQWETDQVYKIGGKMFAVLGPTDTLAFKVNDIAYEMLTETGGARPAPYMARAKWVFLDDLSAMPDDDLEGYLREAHAIVADKLTRKQRAEIGLP